MNIKSITVGLLLLVAGIAIGWQLPRPSLESGVEVGERAADRSPVPERARVDSNGGPSSHGESVSSEVLSADSPDTDESGRMLLVPLSLIGELSRVAGVRSLDQELFSKDGRLEEALGITDLEKANLQTAWRATRQRIRDAERNAMTSEELNEWSVRINLPDLATSFTSLGDDFRSTVHGALGENRGEAFLAVKQIDGMFSPLGGARSYTVTSESIGDGNWRYRMTLEGESGTRVWVGASVPEELRHLTDGANIAPSLDQDEAE